MRHSLTRGAILFIASLATQYANGFIPTVGYSLNGFMGTSHTSITKRAVESLDLEYFPITELTNSMRRARNEIAAANAQVDVTDEHNAPSHFDGESFPVGQDRLSALRLEAKLGLAAGDATRGRRAVGQALHTIQDFYSHSNWIESGHIDINRDVLGLDSSTPIARPDASSQTCQNCTTSLEEQADLRVREFDVGCQQACKSDTSHVTPLTCVLLAGCDTQYCANNLIASGQLTSGYYSDEGPEYTKPGNHKCSHGGIFDGSALGTEGINKDSTVYTLSPHAHLHEQAVTVASEATREYIRSFHDDPDVTPEQFRLLMGAGPTIAFAIDTTGSMSDIIAGVRAEALNIVERKMGTLDEPLLYIIAQIQDPATDLIGTYSTQASFEEAINGLGADGGDDCPELAMTAIVNALRALSDGGTLFVFTDAAAKDIELASFAAELAASKRIQVFPILFANSCTSSAGFDLLARASNGQTFDLSSASEAGDATSLVGSLSSSDTVNIASYTTTSDASTPVEKRQDSTKGFTVAIDPSIRELIVTLTSSTASLMITRPDGRRINDTDASITRVDLTGAQIYTITAPASGDWSFELTEASTGSFTLSISGISALTLTSFNFVELRGRPGHEGLFPVSTPPAPNSNATVLAEIDGNFTDAIFQFRTLGGAVISNMSLANGGGNPDDPVEESIFYGNVTIPNGNYTVYVTGHAGGYTFQRLLGAAYLIPTGNTTNTTTTTASPSTSTTSISSSTSTSSIITYPNITSSTTLSPSPCPCTLVTTTSSLSSSTTPCAKAWRHSETDGYHHHTRTYGWHPWGR